MAIHVDADTGAEDWTHRDLTRPRRTRHGDNRADGLMEKDLCLDVALRLGKIIQQKFAGCGHRFHALGRYVYSSEDRTRIATRQRPTCLFRFTRIPARTTGPGASRPTYLNMKGRGSDGGGGARRTRFPSKASRPEEVVKKIARTEKIDESRELAEDVQIRCQTDSKDPKPVKNRGVRKAPFVVLIGRICVDPDGDIVP